jgi:Fe-S-cluster-containing hydrogenase component 2
VWPIGTMVPKEKRKFEIIIECPEEIPCNPCEEACPRGAISIGLPITNLPVLDSTKCSGCGLCIPACPGQAIFILEERLGGETIIGLPYEMLPSLEKGNQVTLLDRNGVDVGTGEVVKVVSPPAYSRTAVVQVRCSPTVARNVRAVKKVSR